MAILDNAIWLTSATGHAENGSTVISEGGLSTTVSGTFTAGAWDASQSGYAVSEFGAFGVSTPISANYVFSTAVANLKFDLQHVNSSGTSYDDQWTIYAYDEAGNLINAADIIAGLTGLVDEIVITNPDGSVTVEAEGGTANNVTINIPGIVSELEVVLQNSDDAPQSGGSGIGDLSFTVLPDTDGDGITDETDVDDDNDGILDVDEGFGSAVAPSTITITFDGDQYAAVDNTRWELRDQDGTLIASDATNDTTAQVTTVAVTGLGTYTFTVFDDWGDGISGGDPASYTIALDGVVVVNSGANPNFGASVTETFDVTATPGARDTDGDGIFDHLDLDSDDDGITDNVEAQSTADYIAPTGLDSDNDGLDDAYEGAGLIPVDTDGDGTADFIDTDSDNDGISDTDEAGHGITQAVIDAAGDADGDGIKDPVDAVTGWDINDDDLDGAGNFTLADSDNDTAADGTGARPLIADFDFRDNTLPDYTVSGTAGADLIDADYLGDPDGDIIDGNDHSDGSQDDLVEAGAGNDTINSRAGNDTVYAGSGDDTLFGGAGNDTLLGEADADTIVLENTFGNDIIDGGSTGTDNDTLDLTAITDALTIDLTAANAETGTVTDGTSTATFAEIENITLSSGVDTLLLSDGGGADTVYGFAAPTPDGLGGWTGIDMLDVSTVTTNGTTPITTNHVTVIDDGNGNAVLTFPGGESLTLIGITPAEVTDPAVLHAMGIPLPDGTVSGTSGDDNIDGAYILDPDGDRVDANDAILPGDTGNDDLIYGYGGNDAITAGDGNDEIYGGIGNDSIDGSGGKDTLYGGAGNDILMSGFDDGTGDIMDGGDGIDEYRVITSATQTMAYNVNLTTGTDQYGNTYANIENVTGGLNNDALTGDAGTNVLSGEAGNDTLDGAAGNDTLLGQDGLDTLLGGLGDDALFGGADDDYVIISDGFGTDTIDGGETVTTGTDNDTLDLSAVTSAVTVTATGSEAGTITDGTNSLSYTGIEEIVLTGFDDIANIQDPSPLDLYAGAGDDTVTGASSLDTVYGGTGNDTIIGQAMDGAGISSLFGGAGDDTIDGLDRSDIIFGGSGNDTLEAGEEHSQGDNDTLYGGTGDDILTSSETASTGTDRLFGGDGNDEIRTSGGTSNTLSGDAGNDTLTSGTGADSIFGGDDADTILVEDGFNGDVALGGEGGLDSDTVNFGGLSGPIEVILTADEAGTATDGSSTMSLSEIESIIGSSFDDTLDASGSTVSQTLAGQVGNDTIIGGDSADFLIGGDDQDVIYGGGGDIIDGGSGGTDYDTLILGEFGTTITYDALDPESGTVEYADGSILTFSDIENIVPCFTPGTLIRTVLGDIPVERLVPGDMVLTKDHGYQPLAWTGKRHLTAQALGANSALNPILIRQDALGAGLPCRDMMVSPQHRMLITSPAVQLWLGVDDALVKAKDLTHLPGIDQTKVTDITYIHVMFAAHQIILADGAWTESFQPGDMLDAAPQAEARREILALFPELARHDGRERFTGARLSAKCHEARLVT